MHDDNGRLRLTPLGGVGEFGRNCLLVEWLGENPAAVVIDCGARFLGDDGAGYDIGLPDLERLEATRDHLLGYLMTHGHEDHIGGLPYAWRDAPAPVFSTAFTARLIRRRCERILGSRNDVDLRVVAINEVTTLGPFRFELLAVSHSVPDATALVLHTPIGTLVHSGDFRVDLDPVLGPPTDLEGLARIGDQGVLCLLADSTGALTPGHNPGERSVGPPLQAVLSDAPHAVFVGLFASHLQRLSLLAELCRATDRKLGLLGQGLRFALQAGRDAGLLHIDDVTLDEASMMNLPRRRRVWAMTGTQGEPRAALARIARGDGAMPALERGDRVVLSSRIIPGNERRVSAVLDGCAARGAQVVDSRGVHVSGHGSRDDLFELLAATRPRRFVALHGNPRHLVDHRSLANEATGRDVDVVALENGTSLTLGLADTALSSLPLAEPFAMGEAVDNFPRSTVQARRRMHVGGVVVVHQPKGDDDDDVVVVTHATGPVWSPELAELVRHAARSLWNTGDHDGSLRTLRRRFAALDRAPPEFIVVR
jgi:ribonuclease J